MTKTFNGNFGNLARAYDKARPSYPQSLINYLFRHIEVKNPRILDLGCGTGISTRLLAKKTNKKVIGADIDRRMLEVARSYKTKNVLYKMAKSERLPFGPETFDVVTAFTAFHWFANKDAVKEMLRVLKPNGLICIVGIRVQGTPSAVLKKYISKNLKIPTPKIYYQGERFVDILKKSGAKRVISKTINIKDHYSLKRYLLYVQSVSRWNFVPRNKREATLDVLRKIYERKLRKGKITETRVTQVLIASK